MVKKRLHPDPDALRQLLSIEEVMRILHVARSTVYVLIRSGHLQAVHIGRALRFRPEDVQACISHRTGQHAPLSRPPKVGR